MPLPRYTPKPFMPTAGGVRLLGDPVDALRRRGKDWRMTLQPGDYTAMLDYNRRLAANPSQYIVPSNTPMPVAPRSMSTGPLVAGAAHDPGRTYRSPYGSVNVNFSGRKSDTTAANPNLVAPPVQGDFGSFDPVSGKYTANAVSSDGRVPGTNPAYGANVDPLAGDSGIVSPAVATPQSVVPPMLATPQIGSGLAPLESTPTGSNPLADAAQQTVGDRVGAGIASATSANGAVPGIAASPMTIGGRVADAKRDFMAKGGSSRTWNSGMAAAGVRPQIDGRATQAPRNSSGSGSIREQWGWGVDTMSLPY